MRKLIFILMIIVVFAFPINVNADAAPPEQAPGTNLAPGSEVTQVGIVAETVTIEVLPNTSKDSMGQAKVTADFTMRNLSNESESMEVRFPLGRDNGWPGWKGIEDIVV